MENLTDINEIISKLEQQENKLKKIFEAQKALEEIIPIKLQSNLNVLQKHFPQLYEKFKNYKLQNNYKLTCNENGEPNILLDNGKLFYGDSPFDDCKRQVQIFLQNTKRISPKKLSQENNPYSQLHFFYKNKLFKEISEYSESVVKTIKQDSSSNTTEHIESYPMVMMFGLGLGFHLGYLYEKVTPINLYIFEPNEDFFYLSLCCFDYEPLINYIIQNKLGIKFNLNSDKNKIIHDLDNYVTTYGPVSGAKSAYFHYQSDDLTEFKDILSRDISSIQIKAGFFDDSLIGMSQCCENILNGIKFLGTKKSLPQRYKKIPLIIVGNGPSLDQDLSTLKSIESKVIILACGTALSALTNYGIKADFYVAVERTNDVYKSLLDIKDKSIFDSAICIAPDVVYPKTISFFKHKAIAFKFNEVMLANLALNKKIKNYNDFFKLQNINPLVSNMGLAIGAYFKFNEIYLVGIDNGSAFEEAHSTYSSYYDDNRKLKEKNKNMVLNNLGALYPGNFRETIKTNDLFKLSIREAEIVINANKKSIHFYNSSDGAKINDTTPKRLSDEDWSKYPEASKEKLKEYFLNKMLVTPTITKEDMVDSLRVERANEIFDTLIHDLEHLPKNRVEIILRLEAHLDYIRNVYKEGMVALNHALIGSLTLMYVGLSASLYIKPNENEAIDDVQKFVKIIIDFITKVKHFYPQAFEYNYEYILKNVEPI